MAYLLDTHTILWFLNGDKKLPTKSKVLIEDIDIPCSLSVISIWEIVIKRQLGKLDLGMDLSEFFQFIERNQIEILPVELVHLIELSNLPIHHSDPFDRLIISQALGENMTIIGCDDKFKDYPVKIIWN